MSRHSSEVEAAIANIERALAEPEPTSSLDPEVEILKYQAGNDNTHRRWLRWVRQLVDGFRLCLCKSALLLHRVIEADQLVDHFFNRDVTED